MKTIINYILGLIGSVVRAVRSAILAIWAFIVSLFVSEPDCCTGKCKTKITPIVVLLLVILLGGLLLLGGRKEFGIFANTEKHEYGFFVGSGSSTTCKCADCCRARETKKPGYTTAPTPLDAPEVSTSK
jgi:hypothetical protein